ncbi:MAG TPA: hypothetical protein VL588_02275, partial [Bdellovibrionota bacterium]|nr:hypothetical protein [Bdellovibrionota bacterium]
MIHPEPNPAGAKAPEKDAPSASGGPIRDLKDLMAASKPFAVDDMARSTFHLLSTIAILAL